MKLRVGTRGSQLALAQAREATDRLRETFPRLEVSIVEIRTTGDRNRDVPLGPDLGQAFFTREIEDALLEGKIDVAVHSCKDLATVLPDGLTLGAVLKREDPRDVLISRSGRLRDLAPGALVATGSIRRASFLKLTRPDLQCVPIRGNVPTRLGVVTDGKADAVVLAAAGLHRLDLAGRITEYLDPVDLPPAAGQGAIALQCRKGEEFNWGLAAVDHRDSRQAVEAERSFMRSLQAGCQAPVGSIAHVAAGDLVLHVSAAAPAGRADLRVEGPATEARAIGMRAAELLLERLGMTSLRQADWAGSPPGHNCTVT